MAVTPRRRYSSHADRADGGAARYGRIASLLPPSLFLLPSFLLPHPRPRPPRRPPELVSTSFRAPVPLVAPPPRAEAGASPRTSDRACDFSLRG